jgi:hypothetical protein
MTGCIARLAPGEETIPTYCALVGAAMRARGWRLRRAPPRARRVRTRRLPVPRDGRYCLLLGAAVLAGSPAAVPPPPAGVPVPRVVVVRLPCPPPPEPSLTVALACARGLHARPASVPGPYGYRVAVSLRPMTRAVLSDAMARLGGGLVDWVRGLLVVE